MNNYALELPNLSLDPELVERIRQQINPLKYQRWIYNRSHVEYFDQNIIEHCLNKGITITDCEIFLTPPRVKSLPHADDVVADSDMAKINFIYGAAETSYMAWWQVPDHVKPEIKIDPTSDSKFLYIDEEALIEIHRQRLVGTYLVNAGVFHNVQNLDLFKYRLCISYALRDSSTEEFIKFSEAVRRLS